MEIELIGTVKAPAITIVGSWDPITDEGYGLLSRLCAGARAGGLAAVPVMLDPPPAQLVNGHCRWPAYHDFRSRLRLLRDSGVDAVAVIRFSEQDLFGTAGDLFGILDSRLCVAEFWLKQGQALGRGRSGSDRAAAIEAARRDIRLKVVGAERSPPLSVEARKLLVTGSIRKASRLVGQPPCRYRALPGEPLELDWPPGTYQYVSLEKPGIPPPDSSPIAVRVSRLPQGRYGIEWPARSDWIAFTSGPGDGPGLPSIPVTPIPYPQHGA